MVVPECSGHTSTWVCNQKPQLYSRMNLLESKNVCLCHCQCHVYSNKLFEQNVVPASNQLHIVFLQTGQREILIDGISNTSFANSKIHHNSLVLYINTDFTLILPHQTPTPLNQCLPEKVDGAEMVTFSG